MSLLKKDQISEELKRLMPKARFSENEESIKELVKGLVASGLGQSSLQKNDEVVNIKGMTAITVDIKGQQNPVEYLALVVDVKKPDGSIKERATSFGALMRRKPGATKYHGVFEDSRFDNVENYQQAFDKLKEIGSFKVVDIHKQMDFGTFKANVYETAK